MTPTNFGLSLHVNGDTALLSPPLVKALDSFMAQRPKSINVYATNRISNTLDKFREWHAISPETRLVLRHMTLVPGHATDDGRHTHILPDELFGLWRPIFEAHPYITALLDNERDINAVLNGISGAGGLREVLARLDTKQQAIIMGHAVPMPVVIKPRTYDEEFYKSFENLSPAGSGRVRKMLGSGDGERRIR